MPSINDDAMFSITKSLFQDSDEGKLDSLITEIKHL